MNQELTHQFLLAWMYVFGELPGEWLDHINRVRNDNRIANLRLATRKLNAENASIRADNKSGIKGVSWHKKSQTWIAQISHHSKRMHLGCFPSAEAARLARIEAEANLFIGVSP